MHQPDISGWLSTQNCKCKSSLFCFTISSKSQISGNRFVIVSFVLLTWTVVLPASFFCNIMWLLSEYIIGDCRRNSKFGSRIHGSGHRDFHISCWSQFNHEKFERQNSFSLNWQRRFMVMLRWSWSNALCLLCVLSWTVQCLLCTSVSIGSSCELFC